MAQGQRQRFRRLGSTTTAVSAGALVLVFLGAPAAYAGTAAPKPCKKGTDPQSTIENWKCQLGNLRESLTPKKPQTTPKKTAPSKKPPLKKSSGGKSSKSSKGSPAPSGGGSGGQAQQGNGPVTLNRPGSVQPYTPSTPAVTPNLPGVLPTPEVAADPRAYLQRPGAPQTRLISPVAASDAQDGEVMWVAAAAAAAGAVGALNLSVLGRRLRRRAESGV
ncbi:hypothetical protein GCM10010411_26010 [Actinomadura fulvescens]|uniref:Uncharacterized protein n=2 Tax=Actinomadura fulvescens TaxID=46160 RepID=A0ABP6BX54_9ACTN